MWEQLQTIWQTVAPADQPAACATLFGIATGPNVCVQAVTSDHFYSLLVFARDTGLNLEQTDAFLCLCERVHRDVCAVSPPPFNAVTNVGDAFANFKRNLLANSEINMPASGDAAANNLFVSTHPLGEPRATAAAAAADGDGNSKGVPMSPFQLSSFKLTAAAAAGASSAADIAASRPSSASSMHDTEAEAEAVATTAATATATATATAAAAEAKAAKSGKRRGGKASGKSADEKKEKKEHAKKLSKKEQAEADVAAAAEAAAAQSAADAAAAAAAAVAHRRRRGRFSPSQVALIADFMSGGLFAHYRLYHAVFNRHVFSPETKPVVSTQVRLFSFCFLFLFCLLLLCVLFATIFSHVLLCIQNLPIYSHPHFHLITSTQRLHTVVRPVDDDAAAAVVVAEAAAAAAASASAAADAAAAAATAADGDDTVSEETRAELHAHALTASTIATAAAAAVPRRGFVDAWSLDDAFDLDAEAAAAAAAAASASASSSASASVAGDEVADSGADERDGDGGASAAVDALTFGNDDNDDDDGGDDAYDDMSGISQLVLKHLQSTRAQMMSALDAREKQWTQRLADAAAAIPASGKK
jgi:hypothetical protein